MKCVPLGEKCLEVISEERDSDWDVEELEGAKSSSHAQQSKQNVNEDRDATEAAFQRLAKSIQDSAPNPPSILKCPIFGTSMKNIPHDIKQETVFMNLKQDFPMVMNHRDVTCQVYKNLEMRNNPDAKSQSLAVVTGARGEIRDLQRQSFSKSMYFQGTPYNYVFLPDFGAERTSNGNRLHRVSGTAFHVVREREGPQQRHGIKLFTPEFRALIPEKIMNPLVPSTLCLQHTTFTNDTFPPEGIYRAHGRGRAIRRIFSASELEAIQLIRKMNGSDCNGELVTFENERRTVRSRCCDQKGLGLGGEMIKFDEFTHTIPLSWIDKDIRNEAFIDSFSYKCFRCEQKYILVATSCNLEYLLGKCGCDGRCLTYEQWNTRQVPVDSPYHFPDEVNTRLSYNISYDAKSVLTAIPYLPKISNIYPTVQMMCNILLPILEEEWRAVRDESLLNFCSGTIVENEFLMKLEKEMERRYLHIVVKRDKFWSLHKCTAFKEVTIKCDVKVVWKQKKFDTTVRGFLSDAKAHKEGKLLLFYEVNWKSSYELIGTEVVLTPHADKSEYVYCRRYLNQLPGNFAKASSSSSSSSPQLFTLSKLLVPNKDERSWLSAKQLDMASVPDSIRKVHKDLNPEQAKAFIESMSYKEGTSIIQGPPGTGKSYLVGAIALGLSKTRPGVVLCTAGSNIACDVIYEQIEKNCNTHDIVVNVCRVYSRGREILLCRNQTDNENSTAESKNKPPKRALHNLVAAHPRYLCSRMDQFRKLRELIENGQAYKMTKKQRQLFLRHILWIEKQILQTENIIIMTVGCFAAYRLGKVEPTKEEEDDFVAFLPGIDINSVLVDEAGILSQTAILPLETVNAPKIILIGDHLQLTPQVLSRSAEEAGLVRSLMELLVIDKTGTPVPITMLRQQFRAHPDLRHLTSHITYNDKLYDASTIPNRVEVIKSKFYEAFPQFQNNRLWVIHHNGKEKKVSSSRANDSEATIVRKTVKDFLATGSMAEKDIVVLTTYEAQRKMIEECLKKDGFGQILCKNVDEFQGNESTCVIVSFTRSNSDERLGFLMIANRLNVCISRAKEVMVIVMNVAMLKPFQTSNSHLGKLFRYFRNKRLVTSVEVDPSERLPNMRID